MSEKINVLRIENLSVSFGEKTVLHDVNLDVKKGEFLGIIGPNGGGKTTLLKAILGINPNYSGKITLLDGGKNAYSKIGYVPQFSLLEKKFPITVLEVVMTAFVTKSLNPFMRYKKIHREKAMEKLKFVGIDHLSSRQISGLSGGEFQRLLIARALACEPEILILDEPTASVDPASRDLIYSLLENLNDKITIIMVTHDLFAISSMVKSIACLNGDLVYHGAPVLSEETVQKLYGCPVDLIAHGVPHRVLGEHSHKNDGGHSHD